MSASSYEPGYAARAGTTGVVPAAAVETTRPGWAAVTGGALVATAVTVMLVALGSGIGLGSVSPTSGGNPSPATFGVLAAIWLIVVQWVSSFFGGYLAGRLRPTATYGLRHPEALFRDTALGFVTWALASLIVVAMVSGGAGALLGGAGKAVGGAASSAMHGAAMGAASGPSSGSGAPSDYLVDMLFRPATPNPSGDPAAAKTEAAGILAQASTGDISAADHDYLVQVVSARTGLPQDQATQRVDDVIGKEQAAVQKAVQAANAARKFAAEFSIYTFFSMLIGAFISCVAAAIGGRQRDSVV